MSLKKETPERYKVAQDESSGGFQILDCWHPSVENLKDFDVDIPPDSPALKSLNLMEVNSLLGYLDKIGWLDKFSKFSPATKTASRPTGEVIREDIRNTAISTIGRIVSSDKPKDEGMIKEAIIAIREIVEKGKTEKDLF